MSKIMLIGGRLLAREMLAGHLHLEGFQVAEAPESQEALEEMVLVCPDLVIVDLEPAASPLLDLLLAMRRRHYNLPVILVSAGVDQRQDLRALAADYLLAPAFHYGELRLRIAMALEAQASQCSRAEPASRQLADGSPPPGGVRPGPPVPNH